LWNSPLYFYSYFYNSLCIHFESLLLTQHCALKVCGTVANLAHQFKLNFIRHSGSNLEPFYVPHQDNGTLSNINTKPTFLPEKRKQVTFNIRELIRFNRIYVMSDIYNLFFIYVHEFETYLLSPCLTLYVG